MRRLTRFHFYLSFIVLFIFSCQPRTAEKHTVRDELSPKTDSLLRETAKTGTVYTKSLVKQLDTTTGTFQQLLLLNRFAENRRAGSPQLANEILSLSKKKGSRYNQVYAMLNLGNHYAQQYQFDSSAKYIQQGLNDALRYKYDSLAAFACFMKGTNDYMLDHYDTALVNLEKAIAFSVKAKDKNKELQARGLTGAVYAFKSDFRRSVQVLKQTHAGIKQYKLLHQEPTIYFLLGQDYMFLGDLDSARYYMEQAGMLGKKQNDKGIQVKTSATLVNLQMLDAQYTEALRTANQALTISRQLKDLTTEAFFMNAIGDIYKQREEKENALEVYKQTLLLAEKLKDDYRKCLLLINIGELTIREHTQQGKDSSLYYLRAGMAMAKKLGDAARVADAQAAIGHLYFLTRELDSSSIYFNRSLQTAKAIGYDNKIAYSLNFLSAIMEEKGQWKKAIAISEEVRKLSDISVNREMNYSNSYRQYKQTGNYKLALEYLEKYKTITDSVNSAARSRELSKIEYDFKAGQMKAEQEKKEISYRARQKEKEEEINRSVLVRNFLLIGLLLLLLLVFVVYRSLVANRNAKKVIEEQKKEVERSRDSVEHQKMIIEEKNNEIVQSITYAESIQRALLARETEIKKYFPESFLLYKPKDIVAGDFYFFETTATHVFYAAADCTGHGVPGALVSVVCSNALRRCVNEFNLSEPGRILDKARELIIETFEKSGTNVRDGMDISLISLKRGQTSMATEIQWSGAHNPLWYVQNGNMKEITADKQPVGLSEKPQFFTTHTLQLQKGDMVYLFTDGYADQFGGTRGKKLKHKNLQEILLLHALKPAAQQVLELEEYFTGWRGDLEQVDDVCIIGIRL